MKAALPILIFSALAVLLLVHNRRSNQDTKWQAVKNAMDTIRANIQPGSVIGCQVDSNHTREFYECRYWLAPAAVLQGNAPERDTQLVIMIHDDRPVRPATWRPSGDTLQTLSRPDFTAFLIKINK